MIGRYGTLIFDECTHRGRLLRFFLFLSTIAELFPRRQSSHPAQDAFS